MIKCTPFLSLYLTSSFSTVSPRMEMSQTVHRFQPVTSYLSCSISTSPPCFKISVIPLVLKKLLKNHSLLSQLFWDTWDAQDALCSSYRSQHPATSKSREKALCWMLLSFLVSFETFFYLHLLEVLTHFQLLVWIYLHLIIFLEQMVDSHSKKNASILYWPWDVLELAGWAVLPWAPAKTQHITHAAMKRWD